MRAGWDQRRLKRALAEVHRAFVTSPLTGNALVRAVRAYRKALYLALDVDPEAAVELFHTYDASIPADQHHEVAGPQDEGRLAKLLGQDDLSVVSLVFEVACRSRLSTLQGQASRRLPSGSDSGELPTVSLRTSSDAVRDTSSTGASWLAGSVTM